MSEITSANLERDNPDGVVEKGVRILLVLSIILSTQNLILIQTGFALRQDFIAQELCINRDNPKMKCGGFCYLSKKMHESTQDEEDQRNIANLQVSLSIHFLDVSNVVFGIQPNEELSSIPPRVESSEGVSTSVFRPPISFSV